MRITSDAQIQWQFLNTLYPLLKQALPHIEGLPSDQRRDLRIQNAITTIRHNVLSIPLQLQQVQLSQELTRTDFDHFTLALHSLLSVFERLVREDVRQYAEDAEALMSSTDIQLRSQYPKLSILSCLLQISNVDAPVTDATPDQIDNWHAATNYSTDILLELAKYIDFCELKAPVEYQYVSKGVQAFHSAVQSIFIGSLGATEGDLGNSVLLRDDEIEFIRRAHHLNFLSTSLFKLLVDTTTCSKAHTTRMYLSGFLEPDFTFDLLVAACEKQSWSSAKCKWVFDRPQERNNVRDHICINTTGGREISKTLNLAFNSVSIWDDTPLEPAVDYMDIPTALPTLGELVLPGTSSVISSTSDACEFEPEDQKIVELLLASSVLHLNTSHWLRGGLDMDRVIVFPTLDAQDPLKRWRLYITSSLESSTTSEQDCDEDIISLGLLIMEIEAKRTVKPVDGDIDWITGLPSRDSMLKRALTDWRRKLEDGYQQIGKACLQFQEISQKFYHPALPDNMKRTAAIYRYILAPLHQLITQRYCSTSLLFKGFPQSLGSSSAPYSYPSQLSWGSRLTLFDDATWHDPTKVSYAAEFMRDIKNLFVEKIRILSENSPIPSYWATWRAKKIRIVIIDTGIDTDDDILLETALESGRIKDCVGFMGDPGDYKDTHGHGTHVARLILELAPGAELYIAKISNDKTTNASALSHIAAAIKWASDAIEANIISMSFGLEPENRDVEIDKAISKAIKSNTVIFAAAANNGGNKPRAYPANRRTGVICIHASDGRGNDGGISPSPEKKKPNNFSTLGMSIESRWKKKKVLKSGTSFATPIAVALAADVLEFARYKCPLDEYEMERLYSCDGIEEVLHLMAEERQGYDYITPLHLWRSNNEADIARKIVEIARS